MGTDNASLARRFMTEVWSKGNLAAVDELAAPDIVVRDNMGTDIRGTEKVKEMVKMMSGTFADSSFTIDEVITADDRVVIRFTYRGKQAGPFFGIPSTGRSIASPGVEILRIANGKVVEDIGLVDTYTMFEQLGALPPREKLAESASGARH